MRSVENSNDQHNRAIEAIDDALILKNDLSEASIMVVLDNGAEFREITKSSRVLS
jgi:hypothetical protein